MKEFKCFAYVDKDGFIETGSISSDRDQVKDLMFRLSPYTYYDDMDREAFCMWFEDERIVPITIVVEDGGKEINNISVP